MKWKNNFFDIIKIPTILFTDATTNHELQKVPPNVQVVISSIDDFACVRKRGHNFWKKQFDQNSEKEIHKSWQLGAVWYEKKNFVLEAMKRMPTTEYFIWADFGIFRNSHGDNLSSYFPLFRNFGHYTEHFDDSKFHLLQMQEIPKDEPLIADYNIMRPFPYRVGAGIFGGNRLAWELASTAQESTVDIMTAKEQCVFKEQNVWSNCVKMYPELFTLEQKCQESDWFALLFRFSKPLNHT